MVWYEFVISLFGDVDVMFLIVRLCLTVFVPY